MNSMMTDFVMSLSKFTDLYATILHGNKENSFHVNLKSYQTEFTIGDDIDLLHDQLKNSNPMSNHRSDSSSIFQNSDESFDAIKCTRIFFTPTAKSSITFYTQLYVCLIFTVTLFFEIFGENENPEIKAILILVGSHTAYWLLSPPVFFVVLIKMICPITIHIFSSLLMPLDVKSKIVKKFSRIMTLLLLISFLFCYFLSLKVWLYYYYSFSYVVYYYHMIM